MNFTILKASLCRHPIKTAQQGLRAHCHNIHTMGNAPNNKATTFSSNAVTVHSTVPSSFRVHTQKSTLKKMNLPVG